MFEARMDTGALSEALDAISGFVDECKMFYDSCGIRFVAAGYSNIIAADIAVDDTAFEYIKTEGGVVGAHVSRLRTILNMIDSSEKTHIEIDGRTLQLRTKETEYTTRLLGTDVIDDYHTPDEATLPAEVTLSGETANRLVQLADTLSETITLHVSVSKCCFQMIAENGHESVHVDYHEEELIAIDPAPAKSIFSVQHLAYVTDFVSRDSNVRFKLGENCPTEIHVGFENNFGTATYYIAPKQPV